MKLIESHNNLLTIQLDTRELVLINNSINETLEAVKEWEFETRVGASWEAAKQLLASAHTILSKLAGT